MKELKAVEILEEYRNNILNTTEYDHKSDKAERIGSIISQIDEALAELQAHKAKIESLKEFCEEEMKHSKNLNYVSAYTAYKNTLQKLEEIDK